MGFDNECVLNIHLLPGEYFCPVCRSLVYPNEAFQSQCTHLYCKPCLDYIVDTTCACPYDGYLVTEEDSKPLRESNKYLAETIGELAVHCLYHRSGCQWQGSFSDCITHCTKCTFGESPVICNRCGTQIMHRQVPGHGRTCTGVPSQKPQVEELAQDPMEQGQAAAEDQVLPTCSDNHITRMVRFDNECVPNIHLVPGEYFCPVCCSLVYPNEAFQSQCTHLYCKPCLDYIAETTCACPYDGYLVTKKDSKPLRESDKSLAETIGELAVQCLYHRSGCKWQGSLSDCITHCTKCTFGESPVICNRCGTQILHRQVPGHGRTCTGVPSKKPQVEEQDQDPKEQGQAAAEVLTRMVGFDNECVPNIHLVPGEYFCPVCRKLVYPNEAFQSQCTHLYCKPCLDHIVKTTRACPYDGYLVTKKDSKPLRESNKYLAETIGELAVHCLYHRSGCQWQGSLSDYITHCTKCTFGESAVICNRCGTQVMHREAQDHEVICTGVPSQTPHEEGQDQDPKAQGQATSEDQPLSTTSAPAPATTTAASTILSLSYDFGWNCSVI